MTSYTVINPATEQPVTQVRQCTAAEADAAIERAATAAQSWRAVAPADRARLLRRFAEQVDAHSASSRRWRQQARAIRPGAPPGKPARSAMSSPTTPRPLND